MRQIIDLTGQRFERLTVIEMSERDSRNRIIWKCICDCGNEKYVPTTDLRGGRTKSCGCLSSEVTAERNTKHGHTKRGRHVPEYKIWRAMKDRCYNPNNKSFKNYGGRGIMVCDRWLNSFENFLVDMGKRPSVKLSIDRIDNNGNYEPSNCRWATAKEQQDNKRNLHNQIFIHYNGERVTLSSFADTHNIPKGTIHSRISRGYTPQEAVEILLLKRNISVPTTSTQEATMFGGG